MFSPDHISNLVLTEYYLVKSFQTNLNNFFIQLRILDMEIYKNELLLVKF